MYKFLLIKNFELKILIITFFLISIFHKHKMFVKSVTTGETITIFLLIFSFYIIIKNNKFFFNKTSFSVMLFLILNLFLYFVKKDHLAFNHGEYFGSIIKLFFYSIFFLFLYNLLKLKFNKFFFSNFIFQLTFYYAVLSLIILLLQYLKIYFKIPIPLEFIWFGLGDTPGTLGGINGSWSIGGFDIYKTRGLHMEPSFYGMTINLFLFIQIKINNINYKNKKFLLIIFSLINTFSITTYILTLINILLIIRKNPKLIILNFKQTITYLMLVIVLLFPVINSAIIKRLILVSEFKDRSAIKRLNYSIDSALYNLKKSRYLGSSVGNEQIYVKVSKYTKNNEKYFVYRTAKSEFVSEYKFSYGIIFLYILSASGIIGFLIFCSNFLWLNDNWSKIFLFTLCLSSGSFYDSLFWLSLTILNFINND